ncbi:MAG TPA: ribonuclease Z [Bacteroidia bacterium]|nr:ribonuclease Z [Bacteroidia bacterium]
MNFDVTILGSSSATPIYDRHPSAQVLNIHERFFLVDCGEGTQMQLNRYRIRYHRINHIFISHLHGDHYLGLMGLLSTMHLQGRKDEMHLFGPKELMQLTDLQLEYSQTVLRYPLTFHEVNTTQKKIIFEDEVITVESIPMNHRINCCGFLFREKEGLRKLIREKLEEHQIPHTFFNELKKGKDFVNEQGKVIPNGEITLPPNRARSYACCSDTIYDENLVRHISGVDLLYHEATFTNDMLERAKETFHSTASQAAAIAGKAKVKQLLIGHFSARYKELTPLLDEAVKIFPRTVLALEGEKFPIPED